MGCNNSANVPCKIDGCVGCLRGLSGCFMGHDGTGHPGMSWDVLLAAAILIPEINLLAPQSID